MGNSTTVKFLVTWTVLYIVVGIPSHLFYWYDFEFWSGMVDVLKSGTQKSSPILSVLPKLGTMEECHSLLTKEQFGSVTFFEVLKI